MRIIAHRGASARAPENTLAAFRAALEAGVGMIELDVHLTADGVPVVIHDDALSRTTDGEGRVAERTLEDLRRLSAGAWFDERYHTERVPVLEEVFRLVGPRWRSPGRPARWIGRCSPPSIPPLSSDAGRRAPPPGSRS
jgi:glycerophosphoryl diester phosphodiesterase